MSDWLQGVVFPFDSGDAVAKVVEPLFIQHVANIANYKALDEVWLDFGDGRMYWTPDINNYVEEYETTDDGDVVPVRYGNYYYTVCWTINVTNATITFVDGLKHFIMTKYDDNHKFEFSEHWYRDYSGAYYKQSDIKIPPTPEEMTAELTRIMT